jgi:hypothetical protein
MALFGLLSLHVLVPMQFARVCHSVSRLALRHRAAILNPIIINKNLKLLQINYLARKVDVLFNFPSRSHCTCNRNYGKTVYLEISNMFKF